VSQRSGATPPAAGSRVRRVTPVVDATAPLYTVSQAASMLGVQAAFLRRLDSEGIVIPARSSGGQRRYSITEINHVAAVAALMGEGMTLAGAQRIIELENEIAGLRNQLTELRRRRPERAAR